MGDAIKPLPYTDDELLGVAGPRRFSGEHLNEIAFPLGGIGTGCVSLSGRGSLVDWEIFNRPNKGYRPHYTFMSLHVQEEGEEPIFRVLEGTIPPSYQGRIHNRANYAGFGWGPAQEDGGGLARFRECEFVGTFPTADVNLSDDRVGYKIREASLQKLPYVIVVGEKEQGNQTVNVRSRDKGELGEMSLESFVADLGPWSK